MSKDFYIEILHEDKNSHARYGYLHTPHGTVELPMFMPVVISFLQLKTIMINVIHCTT